MVHLGVNYSNLICIVASHTEAEKEGLTWLLTTTSIFPGNFIMASDISKISACFLGNHLSFIPYEPMQHDSSVNSEAAAATQLNSLPKDFLESDPCPELFHRHSCW